METKTILSNYGDVLKPEDLQEILQTGRNSVYSLLKNGEIKSLMIGGKYGIPKRNISQSMNNIISLNTDQNQ